MNLDSLMKNKKEDSEEEVIGIFPTLIKCCKFRELYEEEYQKIEELVAIDKLSIGGQDIDHDQYMSHQHYRTKDSYILDNNSELNEIREYCEKNVNSILKNELNIDNDLELRITQSWINVITFGGWHPPHPHPNSIISGVFYVGVGDEDALMFQADVNSKNWNTHFDSAGSPWCANEFYMRVNSSDLILFPAHLVHSAKHNATDKLRVSLSFNTFVKSGNLGRGDDLTEVKYL